MFHRFREHSHQTGHTSLNFPLKRDATKRNVQKEDYDRRHKVKAQPDLDDGQLVWIRTDNDQQTGQVLTAAHTPRSYLVQTSSGTVQRNQSHLICQPEWLDDR